MIFPGNLAHNRDSALHDLRFVALMVKKEFALQARYPTKLALDLLGQILGVIPIILMVWGMGRTDSASQLTSADYIAFVYWGYAAFALLGFGNPILLHTGIVKSVELEQRIGTLERNFVLPAGRATLLFGIGLYHVCLALLQFSSLVIFGSIVLGIHIRSQLAELSSGLVLLTSLLVMNCSIGFIGVSALWRLKSSLPFELLVHSPLVILSGAYFKIDVLPTPVYFLALANPVTFMVDGLRCALTGTDGLLPVQIEAAIAAVGALATVGLARVVFRRSVRSLWLDGSLGLY